MFELDYGFTEDQKMMRDLARKIAREQIRPVAAKYDESGEFPWPIMKILAEAGLFGVFIPEAYGGTGGGVDGAGKNGGVGSVGGEDIGLADEHLLLVSI